MYVITFREQATFFVINKLGSSELLNILRILVHFYENIVRITKISETQYLRKILPMQLLKGAPFTLQHCISVAPAPIPRHRFQIFLFSVRPEEPLPTRFWSYWRPANSFSTRWVIRVFSRLLYGLLMCNKQRQWLLSFFFVNSISCIKHQKSGCYRIIAVSKDIRDYSKIDLNTTSIFFKCFFIFYNNRSLCFGHFKLIFVVKSPYLVVFTVILYIE